MSNAMDRFKLIAEVRKRPALWDINGEEHRSQKTIQATWKDVAVAMGSDVNDCSRMWKSLRSTNRHVVKRIELRIAKDKLNGTYDPNNEYKCKWVFYKQMQFINDIKKSSAMELNDKKSEDNNSNQVSKSHNTNTKMDENNSLDEREMSSAMDKRKLIAEIQKRPALWDFKSEERRTCLSLAEVWEELAVSMGSDVADCKRKWTYLRNAYRQEAKKLELRIKEDKLKGLYDTNNDYSSKWDYFQPMKIIEDIKMSRPIKSHNSSSNDNYNEKVSKVPIVDNIRLECDDDMDTEVYVYNEVDNEDDDTVSQIYSEQEAKKIQLATNTSGPNSPENQEPSVGKPTSTLSNCTKRSYNQANFLEDIEHEQHNSIKSARLVTTRSNVMVHVGNSNHNFLVSFLSKMKKMSEVQNIQFRAKMTDIMLTIQ